MLLSDLLGAEVFAPRFVGFVSDVRFILDPTSTDQPTPTARLYGLVVSPHARSSSLGFERSGVRSPRMLANIVRWRHRGSFLVVWPDVLRLEERRVQLRLEYLRRPPDLSRAASVPPRSPKASA
jgi:hypothetical protein